MRKKLVYTNQGRRDLYAKKCERWHRWFKKYRAFRARECQKIGGASILWVALKQSRNTYMYC